MGAVRKARPSSGDGAGAGRLSKDAATRQLQWDGWVGLPDGRPQWAVCDFAERLHKRYHERITTLLDSWRADWMKGDDGGDAPGADRVGGLVAKWVTEELEGTGIYVYAAHSSQSDHEEDADVHSGPRWYVTIMEAAMWRYGDSAVAPPPPLELQELMWPDAEDRRQPWLTELGWTIVPAGSDPQIMHADICYTEAPHPRQPGRGRYHHMAWKLNREEFCTTNIVPGAFTEGVTGWDHYAGWRTVKAPALVFDSEMLHRGGATPPGTGFSTSLTVQVSSGTGWSVLSERVSESMMWYTQRLGWQAGDAVDALVNGNWRACIVESRSEQGLYAVVLDGSAKRVEDLQDGDLRYRQSPKDLTMACEHLMGAPVEALFDGTWHPAKVARCNEDGTYRVVWKEKRSFTDGLGATELRRLAASPSSKGRKRKHEDSADESTCASSGSNGASST
eukprot:TRINITY_DN16057_c0_g1_i1.p1 TRINITY_DN16057_c0_g1~~TRINITY_DN16057_c0_g1_i1.p1  ORF type:complete len:448 (-),score=58.01 TRINITY_DN16057_c0_g1_i1:143-1486(-)